MTAEQGSRRPRVRRAVVDQAAQALAEHAGTAAPWQTMSGATPAERLAALRKASRDLELRARSAGWRPTPRPRADDDDEDEDDLDDDD